MLWQAKEKLQAHASEAILAVLGTALPTWLLLTETRLVPYVSQLEPTTVIRSVAVLLAVIGWAFALLTFFRPRLKFESRVGIYRDRKSNLYYCPSCHSNKLKSPLKETASGWFCVVKGCRSSYLNPDHKSPPPLVSVVAARGRNSGMGW